MHSYLPSIKGNATVQAQADPVDAFVRLWMAALGDRANLMRPDPRLMRVAQDHAEYLHSRTPEQIKALEAEGHNSHYGQGGTTPNQRVRASGYPLPGWHGNGNTVEFNVRTHKGAARALELYRNSDAHRPALWGEHFWEPAVHYGVGQHGDDWVVLVCPPSVT